jgi:glycosyltransferase involved in cell wall biosynthesis
MESENKRILLATSAYAPTLGGVQSVVENLSIGLHKNNYQVMVLANRIPLKLNRREQLNGVEIERIWFPSFSYKISNFRQFLILLYSILYWPVSIWRLHRLLLSFRPDIVNMHHPQSMVSYFRFLNIQRNSKVITSLHGYDVERFVPEVNRHMEGITIERSRFQFSSIRNWLLQSDLIITNSAYTAEIVRKMIDNNQLKRIHVIHNTIDPDRFQKKNDLSVETEQPFIFSFGRFDRQKGFDLLIEAFQKIKDAIPHHLIIAGSGPEENNLRKQVDDYKLQDKVRFPGRLSPEEVVTYLKASAFVVVPSRWEAFGITVLESLAAGKPVVATDVGGIPEFTQFKHCFICRPCSDHLADQILTCSSSKFTEDYLLDIQRIIWKQVNWSKYLSNYEMALNSL